MLAGGSNAWTFTTLTALTFRQPPTKSLGSYLRGKAGRKPSDSSNLLVKTFGGSLRLRPSCVSHTPPPSLTKELYPYNSSKHYEIVKEPLLTYLPVPLISLILSFVHSLHNSMRFSGISWTCSLLTILGTTIIAAICLVVGRAT